jgi:propanol-preferring alcohol dehydrogenase
MRAMVLEKINSDLVLREVPIPSPSTGELLMRVNACGVCRTDLHIIYGELPHPQLPLIPGHQIVGIVEKIGSAVSGFSLGDKVGVPWLQGSCGHCKFCLSHRENLCSQAVYTGYQKNGGFAEYCTAHADYCFHLPPGYSDTHLAPLLCPGLIGYRSLKITGYSKHIGFYGFGASAHILIQIARHQGREVYAFFREMNSPSVLLAKELGAVWVGISSDLPPVPLDAAIIFAPVGELVPLALKAVDKGGSVVCAGIHMSDIPSFPYSILWEERILRSVANLTRQDGIEFLALASRLPIKTTVTEYTLEEANKALHDLKQGTLSGAAVLKI